MWRKFAQSGRPAPNPQNSIFPVYVICHTHMRCDDRRSKMFTSKIERHECSTYVHKKATDASIHYFFQLKHICILFLFFEKLSG
jgi:hypothetical protein